MFGWVLNTSLVIQVFFFYYQWRLPLWIFQESFLYDYDLFKYLEQKFSFRGNKIMFETCSTLTMSDQNDEILYCRFHYYKNFIDWSMHLCYIPNLCEICGPLSSRWPVRGCVRAWQLIIFDCIFMLFCFFQNA